MIVIMPPGVWTQPVLLFVDLTPIPNSSFAAAAAIIVMKKFNDGDSNDYDRHIVASVCAFHHRQSSDFIMSLDPDEYLVIPSAELRQNLLAARARSQLPPGPDDSDKDSLFRALHRWLVDDLLRSHGIIANAHAAVAGAPAGVNANGTMVVIVQFLMDWTWFGWESLSLHRMPTWASTSTRRTLCITRTPLPRNFGPRRSLWSASARIPATQCAVSRKKSPR